MSKVKFIQWGTPESPKTIEQYNDDFVSVREQYPGGVIFVTYYTDENKTKTKQEIWANSVQYSVGGGGGNVIYGNNPVNAQGVISDGTTGSEGSIYVYTRENTQTAYYWVTTDNGGKWEPFNVDANNVWFHDDITMAGSYTTIGNLSKGSTTGTKSVKTLLGKTGTSFTLLDFVTGMLSKAVASGAKFSTSTNKTGAAGTLTVKNEDKDVSNNSSFEVGTTLTVSASLKTNSSVTQYLTANTATYGYRTTTGGTTIKADYSQSVTPTTANSDSCTLKLKKPGETTASTYSSTTYELANGTHVFTASTTSRTWTGKAFTSATIIPLNNLGQEEDSITTSTELLGTYTNQNLTPTTTSPSITVTGYWPYFYGSLSSAPTAWAQPNLGSKKSQAFTSKEYEIPAGAKVAFVAIPEANSTKTVSIKNSSTTASFSTAVNKASVTVTLGTQSQAYTVFYLTAASATGSDANFKITIS